MKIQVQKGALADYAGEAVMVALFEGEREFTGAAAKMDASTVGILTELIATGDFSGEWKQVAVLYTGGRIPAKRILVAGLGKRKDFSSERWRVTLATAAKQVRSLGLDSFAMAVDIGVKDLSYPRLAEAAVEGICLGLYRFTRYKTKDLPLRKDIREISIIHEEGHSLAAVKKAALAAQVISEAACFARDIVATPANEMTPADLAQAARKSVVPGKVSCRTLNGDRMKRLGMNALLAVGAGSVHPPKLIVLTYRGGQKTEPPIALVGKGLTFDSGGISLKPAEKMELMKSDMAGGAAVIATIRAAAQLALPLNLLGVVPAAENLPSGKAYRPGDILRSLSGQTIEIISTDAEGRLILADALTYTGRFRPAAVIDLATLTGACVVALGEKMIGMMGTDGILMKRVKAAADATAELVWELPLGESYDEMIKGEAADYKNTGGRWGGASTAAAFLEKFTSGYPWVHLDIAGPAWVNVDLPYCPKGASGVGVRLLMHLLRNWEQPL